jgi:hypothetical protein
MYSVLAVPTDPHFERLQHVAQIEAALRRTDEVPVYLLVSCVQPYRIARALSRLPGVLQADVDMVASKAVLTVAARGSIFLRSLLQEVRSFPGVNEVAPRLAA